MTRLLPLKTAVGLGGALFLIAGLLTAAADPAATAPGETRDALKLQTARNAAVAARGKKSYYPPKYDLSDLPLYAPTHQLTGKLRIWGMNYLQDGQLKNFWNDGFHRYQPNVQVEFHLPTSVTAIPALVTGVADLGATTTLWQWERDEFEQVLGYKPYFVQMVTCSYNVAGWGAADAVFVHKGNPLQRVTMEQLDRIFGAERSGGWIGSTWHPELARGPEKNIRTWGQLGLTGEWADRPIHIYAINLRYHTQVDLSDLILHGSDKWAEDARMYSNVVRANGKIVASFDLVIEGLSKDPYGIAITGVQTLTPAVRIVPVAKTEDGPAIMPTLDTVHDRSYPLGLYYNWTVKRPPGQPIDPLVKEFLAYTLCRQGQADVMRDGKFFPLTAEVSRSELAKLDDVAPMSPPEPRVRPTVPAVAPYTHSWDLSSLPAYQPAQAISGTIRIWGMPQLAQGHLGKYWAEGFRKFHPDAVIDYHLVSSLAGTSAIVAGAADLGASPRLRFSKLLGFQRLFLDRDPVEIPMFTGSYNVPGWDDAQAVFVHADNPLTGLTLRQLDGIFGTLRDGGWIGTTWHTEPPYSRGPEENIRTWGQLGLTGRWAKAPIHVYNLQSRYATAIFLSDAVLHGGDKLTEGTRVYANTRQPDGTVAAADTLLMADLSADPYGIGFSGIEFRTDRTKPLALAAAEGGPFVPLTIETVQNRTYPLSREAYWYCNRVPGQPLDPKVKEFLAYTLSREGQAEVARDGRFLPLTEKIAREQLKKLE